MSCTILLKCFGVHCMQNTEGNEDRKCTYSIQNTYRRSGNFRAKKLTYNKFSCKKIFIGTTPYRVSVNSAH